MGVQIIHIKCYMSLISQSVYHTSHNAYLYKTSLNLMSHTAVTTPVALRLLLARTTPGPQRSRAESRRLLLARDYSWPVTPASVLRRCFFYSECFFYLALLF